jgi:hypothetical protein
VSVPEIIARTRVTTDEVDVTVSTIRIADDYYDTAIFDEHSTKRDHGKKLGRWVIGHSSERTQTRAAADAMHETAVATAYERRPVTPTFPGGGI